MMFDAEEMSIKREMEKIRGVGCAEGEILP